MEQRKLFRQILLAAALILALHRPLAALAASPQLLSAVILTQTGRVVRPVSGDAPPPTKSITPIKTTQRSPIHRGEGDAVISFSPDQLSFVEVYNTGNHQPDLEQLLTQPEALSLISHAPTVLIIHTHTTESYTGDYPYVEPYRTLDEKTNMLAIGAEVARVLELGGVTVIHDRNIYDYPDYNGAYNASREAVKGYLAQYPSIQLVLDLHRDAAAGDAGAFKTEATVDGQAAAQLMMVVGTDGTGLHHPNWEENLALALKLHVLLEQEDPGITRPITLRRQRFNADLSPGSLLIEVGAAGNSLEEAILAANALARGILKLAK